MDDTATSRRRFAVLTGSVIAAGAVPAAPGATAATAARRGTPRPVRHWARAWNTATPS